jgi:hypothetical protein
MPKHLTTFDEILFESNITKQPTPPQNPLPNQVWMDTSKEPNILFRWDGIKWVPVGLQNENGNIEIIEDLQNHVDQIIDDLNNKANKEEVLAKVKEIETDLATKVNGEFVDGKLIIVNDQIENKIKELTTKLDEKVNDAVFTEEITDILNSLKDKADLTFINGQLVSKADKDNTFTKEETINALNSKVSKTEYTTDKEGIVKDLKDQESRITQTEEEIKATVKSVDYKADQKGVVDRLTQAESAITQTSGQISSTVKKTEYDIDQKKVNDSLGGKANSADLGLLADRVTKNESSITQTAEQIESKVSKTTYEKNVTDTKTKLDQFNQDLDTKASKGELTQAVTRITEAESRITQTEKDITATVKQTVYDKDQQGLISRLSTAESKITQQAGLIESTVTKTEFTTANKVLNDQIEQIKAEAGDGEAIAQRFVEAESRITQTEKDITATVKKVDYEKDQNNVVTRLNTAESKISQTEKDITSKVSSTQYNQDQTTLKTRVTDAESKITQQAGLIESKVTKTDYEKDQGTVINRLTSAESKITQTEKDITSKVSNDIYTKDKNDTLTRLGKAESSITQQAGLIESKVEKTVVSSLDTKVTNSLSQMNEDLDTIGVRVEKTESSIKQTNDSIATSVSSINKKIDGISVGGNNIIPNSLFKTQGKWRNWGVTGGTRTFGVPVDIAGFSHGFQFDAPAAGEYGYAVDSIEVTQGETYTLSAWFKLTKAGTIKVQEGDTTIKWTSTNNTPALNQWIRITHTFVAKGSTISLYFGQESTSPACAGFVTGAQLERGNKATDWSVSTQDLDAAINDKVSNTEYTKKMAEIKVTTDQISQSVSNVDKKVNDQGTRLTTAESKITQTEKDIALKVNSTDVYKKTEIDPKLNAKVDNNTYNSKIASIEATNNSITQRVEEVNKTVTEISVGGSNFYNQKEFGPGGGTTATYNSTLGEWTVTVAANNSVSWKGIAYASKTALLLPGRTYTISYEVYADEVIPTSVDINNFPVSTGTGGNDNDITSKRINRFPKTIAGQWVKASATFTMPDDLKENYFDKSVIGVGGWTPTKTTVFKVRKMQLEEGNIPSDFSVSQGDVDAAINDKVSNTEYTKKLAELKVTTDGITSSVTSTNQRIDGISVGGENLMENTSNFSSTANWYLNSGTSMNIVTKDGFNVLEGVGSIQHMKNPTVKPNTEYILTVEIMFTKDTPLDGLNPIHWWLTDGVAASGQGGMLSYKRLVPSNATFKANTWTTVSILLKTKSDIKPGAFFKFFIYGAAQLTADNKYWLKTVKFEEGNVPSAYSPSSSDSSYGELYVKGVGNDRPSNRSIILNGTEIAKTTGRGHNLICIKRSDLSILDNILYDTHASLQTPALVTKLNDLNDDVIIVLSTWDSAYVNTALATALKRFGGSGREANKQRVPHAFIGIAGIGEGAGIESMTDSGATSPPAEISTKIINGIPQGINIGASEALSRVASAESRITQTEKDITSKVSTTDYNGTKLVSMINQTASTVMIDAKNINLNGNLTISNFNQDVQNKIQTGVDAKGVADSATNTINGNKATWDRSSNINTDGTLNTAKLKGTVSDAQVASATNWNTAKSTVDSNKATWDRATNINADGKFNTSKLNGTLSDAQIASAANWNGAKSLMDSWKSGTTMINGGMIATNTIFAQQINIGDFTNLCQIDESKNPNGFNTAVVNGKRYFKIGPGAYAPVTIVNATTVDFKPDDEYYIAFNGYKEAAVTNLNAIYRYYYSDGTWDNAGTVTMTPGASDARIAKNLKITAEPNSAKTLTSVSLFFEKDSGTSGYYYIRNLEVRKRYGGDLIIDGSLTFDKAKGGNLVLGGANNEGGSLYIRDAAGNNIIYGNQNGINITGGKLTVSRPDGAKFIENGMPSFEFAVSPHQPSFRGGNITTRSWYWYTDKGLNATRDDQVCEFFSFKHTSRYITFEMDYYSQNGGDCVLTFVHAGKFDANGKEINLRYIDFKNTKPLTANEGRVTIDLGVPTYEKMGIYVVLYTWSGPGALARCIRAYLEG